MPRLDRDMGQIRCSTSIRESTLCADFAVYNDIRAFAEKIGNLIDFIGRDTQAKEHTLCFRPGLAENCAVLINACDFIPLLRLPQNERTLSAKDQIRHDAPNPGIFVTNDRGHGSHLISSPQAIQRARHQPSPNWIIGKTCWDLGKLFLPCNFRHFQDHTSLIVFSLVPPYF